MEPIVNVNLSIKSVPEALAERLRQRAERNHRSLQGELMAIIERAANEEPASAAAPRQTMAAQRRGGAKSIEQLMVERRLRPLGATKALPRAVDIIREARDSRGSR